MIYNLISISVIGYNFYAIYHGLINNKYNLYYSMNVSLFLERIIKYSTTGIEIFKRPIGACGCGLFNEGGNVSHASGFPSGHMIVTSTFFNNLLIIHKKENDLKYVIIYNIPCLLMAFARYGKSCHDIPQIIAGYFLGYIVSQITSN